MASTTFTDIRNKFDNDDFIITYETAVIHDELKNEVFTDWFNEDGSINTPPATAFGAGIISPSTGIKISTEDKWKETMGQGYTDPVKTKLESTTKHFDVEYMQLPKRLIMAETTGAEIPEALAANGTISFLQDGAPKNQGLITYILNAADTPFGDILRVDILAKVKVTGRADFEVKGTDDVTQKVQYTAYNNPKAGFAHMTIMGGPGFKAAATDLGFKAAA